MHWIHITDEDQLQKIVVRSQEKPQIIFKFSSHCHSSEKIFQRLQNNYCPENVDFHFLDLSAHAGISEKISNVFHVAHRSPQILVIKEGECIFEDGHSELCLEEILEHASTEA